MRLFNFAILAGSLAIAPVACAFAADVPLFQFEQQAKLHCPNDTVVWVNPASGIYNFAGERWYGSTKSGSFVCRLEGEQAGYRASHVPERDAASGKVTWVHWLTGN